MATFGFSVGDFIAVGQLVFNLIEALRGKSTFEYRELVIELEGLQRALQDIEQLPSNTKDSAAINSIKVAALMCQYPIQEFDAKLKRYDGLLLQHGSSGMRAVTNIGRKAQWNVSMSQEVLNLRAYLAAHVGSINMRLQTLGLSIAIERQHQGLDGALATTLNDVKAHVQRTETRIGSVQALISGTVTTQLQNIMDLVGRVWTTNIQIITLLTSISERAPSIDAAHTWFQQPIRFEDAYGRVLPIPAEYGWQKIEAIVLDQFAGGPSRQKVMSGEYELFDSLDSSVIISSSSGGTLRPGMQVTMAIVIGCRSITTARTCPRPDCRSCSFRRAEAGGQVCNRCQTWFGMAHSILQRPFRLSLDTSDETPIPSHAHNERLSEVVKIMRNERKQYKNVRIIHTEMTENSSIVFARGGKGDISYIGQQVNNKAPPPKPPQHTMSAPALDRLPGMLDLVRSIVTCELGYEMGEVLADSNLPDMGMDSLMSLTLRGELESYTKLEIPNNLLFKAQTPQDIACALCMIACGEELPAKSDD